MPLTTRTMATYMHALPAYPPPWQLAPQLIMMLLQPPGSANMGAEQSSSLEAVRNTLGSHPWASRPQARACRYSHACAPLLLRSGAWRRRLPSP